MKILDIPQSGKRGINVSQGGRFGQISRALAFPTQPHTTVQTEIRADMATVSRGWRKLVQAKRDAWTAVASGINAKTRLGQTGPLTGNQLYCKINIANTKYGMDVVDDPPAFPEFTTLAPTNLVITNTQGVIAIKLTCGTSPGENTIIRASKPVSQGINRTPDCSVLGMCPTPAQGSADITSLYVAKWGVPPEKSKIFVQANLVVDGYESAITTFKAIVPATS